MEGQKSIIGEVKKHLQERAGKDRYRVIDAVQEMPASEGFILPYYVSTMEGTQYPVNVGGMHICRDEWEEPYNGTAVKAAQAVLEAGRTKEA